MKSVLIVYKSKTGFTKRYVDWITDEITCNTIELEKAKKEEINDYDIIVYGAGMHAGHILGLNKFRKLIDFHNDKVNNKELIIFATGAAPNTDEIVSQIQKNNLREDEANARFFYFESGISYEKMSGADKTLMTAFKTFLKIKSNKSNIEEGTNMAILNSYDNSKKENIIPLISHLNKLIIEE